MKELLIHSNLFSKNFIQDFWHKLMIFKKMILLNLSMINIIMPKKKLKDQIVRLFRFLFKNINFLQMVDLEFIFKLQPN